LIDTKQTVKAALALDTVGTDVVGREMHALIAEIYPICRSITGNGVRDTLKRLQQVIPLYVQEVPTGTRVFDWTVPSEWNIRDAYVKNSRGERVIDFGKSNLHVLNYSVPVHEKMRFEELKPHLFTLPEHPDWIPYRTSYYKRNWGFCLTHKQFLTLVEDEYEVCIDASLENGHLTYGELYLPGDTTDEILVSAHTCHPSLANDNLSGVAIACFLARYISGLPRRYSYRFLFIPGTIGAITWLALNAPTVPRIQHGLVLAGLGDAGPLSYKKSREGDTEIDQVAAHVLRQLEAKSQILEFSPYGYDERQYCSPGFNLAVGRLSRTPHGTFPEYHTSADDLNFISARSLGESFSACASILSILERNRAYVNTNPKCEPQLGERGLYRLMGGWSGDNSKEMAMLWVLNFSDGSHTLLDIAERAQLSFDSIYHAAVGLKEHGLLKGVCKGSAPMAEERA
jgi:aminopeptidase-like protein